MLRALGRWFGIPVAAVGLAACTTHQGRPEGPVPERVETRFETTRDVVFTPPDWPQALKADISVPRGEGPFPAVLVIHGGGWSSGDRSQVSGIARRLAARGYVAVNVQYRLAPQWKFPTQLQDVQQALVWLRENAARYRIDPQRVGAFGYSAGAHLAALLGGVGETPPLGRAGTAVRAVVAGGTPTDLGKWADGKLVVQFMGAPREQMADQYRQASPINYVDAGDPPVFLYYGGMDRLVPVDHTTDYQKKLEQAGVANEVFVLRGRGHILAFLTDGPAVDAAIEFLDRHLRGP